MNRTDWIVLDTTLQENRLVGLRYPPHLALANATLPEQAGWRGLNPLLMQSKHIAGDRQGSRAARCSG
jgi:hypothetical protein